ncbi:MAG: hypothetical protein ACEQSD_04440 [Flavobacteriales bacterium]
MSKSLCAVLVTASLSLAISNAQAACPATAKTVFSCSTTNNKVVDICELGQNLLYSFGRPNSRPELQFNIAKSRAYMYLWDGSTSSEYNELYLPRGNTIYQAYQANHRNHGGTEHGLNVLINKKPVANIRCRANTVIENFQQLELPQISGDERL